MSRTLIRRDLDEGEVLRISSGCLVAFTQSIEYGKFCFVLFCFFLYLIVFVHLNYYIIFVPLDIQMMQGFKNVLFGGEGLFITTLTGPGTVWLQGQPPQRMISEIARRVPSGGGVGFVPVIGGGGGGDSGEGGEGGESDGEDSK
jgi:hypothetical protein